ncbi:MAG: YibE/F family protein [Lachnospiraceae bacterium]|nr:YibE/F family protein [Lachnospiraceae bacterium]
MKKQFWIKAVAAAVFLLISGIAIFFLNKDRPRFEFKDNFGTEYETAKVLAVMADNTVIDTKTDNVKKGSTDLKIEILSGRYKGDVCFIKNYISAIYNVDVGEGDKISVRIDTTAEGVYSVSIYNYNRTPLIIGLLLLFLAVLVIVGGKRGALAFAGLAYTFIAIVFVLIPLAFKGVSPVWATVGILFVTTAFAFILIGGFGKKTLAATIGCMCGVLFAALVGELATRIGSLTIYQTDEAEALLLLLPSYPIKLRGLFTSAILISAIGAVMDVAMSVSSAVSEIATLNPKIGFGKLFKSGLNIGRDAMGTMANTLVLAYAGSALNMMVLIYSYGVSMNQLLNTDFVAIELIMAVSGSIGIVMTVPCVSFVAARIFSKRDESRVTQK